MYRDYCTTLRLCFVVARIGVAISNLMWGLVKNKSFPQHARGYIQAARHLFLMVEITQGLVDCNSLPACV